MYQKRKENKVVKKVEKKVVPQEVQEMVSLNKSNAWKTITKVLGDRKQYYIDKMIEPEDPNLTKE